MDETRSATQSPSTDDTTSPAAGRWYHDAPVGFLIEREIGSGGIGVVYLARQQGLNRSVALKMLRASGRTDPKALVRFLTEAEAVAAIKHPNVVEVYQFGEHHGQPYLAFEYCAGGDLATRLKANGGPLSPRAAAELIAQVADGVAAAHERGIVHRDLKPHNVLLTGDGVPKVADFGLAKRGAGSDLTRTQAVMGTPAYMSPEQAKGETKFVGPQADVWALGVMLYELLSGARPFQADDEWGMLARIQSAETTPLKLIVAEVPPELQEIVNKCLRKQQKVRYQSAAKLAADLRAWLAGERTSTSQVDQPARRGRWLALGLLGLLLVGAGSLVGLLTNSGTTSTTQGDSTVLPADRTPTTNKPAPDEAAETPSLEWVNTPPTGPAAFALIADPNAGTGAVAILIDRSQSMVDPKLNPEPGNNRLRKAIRGVEKLLPAIPNGTSVTIGGFYGEGEKTKVEAITPPFVRDGTADQVQEKMRAVNAIDAPGERTPLAGSISRALDPKDPSRLWPPRFTGDRVLIVLTDGEDNPAPDTWGKPNEVVLKALQGCEDDVNLHIVFFAMDADEEERAVRQFEPLTDPAVFGNTPRTPVTLHRNVKDENAFAGQLASAVLPRLQYRAKPGRLVASVGNQQYQASPPVPPGAYDLKMGGVKPTTLELAAGDRVLLQLTAAGGNPRLGVPAFAHEFAERSASRIPTRGSGGGDPVYLTLPQVSAVTSPRVQSADLKMVAALERPVPAGSATLRQPRPRLAWFDMTGVDGKPPPYLRVENRTDGPVAPVWDLTLPDWDESRPSATGTVTVTVRPPKVSGYWIDDLPAPVGVGDLDLDDFKPSALALQQRKAYPGAGGADRFRGADVITGPGGKEYLTVRWDYDAPGELVFARVTGWKKPVAELHRYYDKSTRYTVRFGPLSADDQTAKVRLELYTVDELRKAGRGVTITFPDRLRVGPAVGIPPELLLQPAK